MPEKSTSVIKHIHEGRNIKRFREMRGIKQEAIAFELGENWTQKRVSRLEEKEKIEDSILQKIAEILKVPQELLKNFDEASPFKHFQFNTENSNSSDDYKESSNIPFNLADKFFELLDENRKLYERLLASEREKIDLLNRYHHLQS